METKKQTAVEWLIEIYLTTGIDRNVHFHQAKAMEKEQIIDAVCFGMIKGLNVNKVPETDNDWVNNYYNETYGN
jgi:hypothetical protein